MTKLPNCTVEGCKSAHVARGYCGKHYKRFKLYGNPLEVQLQISPSAGMSVQQRIDDRSAPVPWSGCLLYLGGSVPSGYGVIRYKGRQQYVHRVAYELAFGKIPDGLLVCHRCDVPSCVNPAHLFLGTPRDNTQDMLSKGRHRTNPATGDRSPMRKHPGLTSGGRNGNAKLTWSKVNEIRRLFAAGETQTSLSQRFAVRRCHINRIVRNESWEVV